MTDRRVGSQPDIGKSYNARPTRNRFPTFGLGYITLILLASYSVRANWINDATLLYFRAGVETYHLISGYICILIVGSILSLDIKLYALAKTLPRMLTIALLASLVSTPLGVLSGGLVGFSFSEALFLIVVPLLSGGINAGVLPLALGYGSHFGNSHEIFAVLLPPVLVGNLIVVVTTGAIGYFNRSRSTAIYKNKLIGTMENNISNSPRIQDLLGAIILLLLFAVAAHWFKSITNVAEPVFLLALSTILLITNVIPQSLRCAIVAVYHLSARVFVVPILLTVGLLYSPWEVLMTGFSLKNLFVVTMMAGSLGASGYLLSRIFTFYTSDGSILAVSRAAMGGAGNIAMLSAAHRLDLMPFAQIVTRTGGAITVFLALLIL